MIFRCIFLCIVLCSNIALAQKKDTTKFTPPSIAPKLAKTTCDCKDAVQLKIEKVTSYGPTLIPEGFGNVQEISTKNKKDKLNFEEEHNSSWYLLNINVDGELVVEIIPQDTANDYDFLLYKYTDTSFCKALLNKKLTPVRSNLSRGSIKNKGITGLSVDAKNEFVGQGIGESVSKSILVTKGEKYMLVLDNVYPQGQGHILRFNYIKRVTISGNIVGSDSLPLKADVLLSDNNGNPVKQIKTGADGKYSIGAGLKEDMNYSLVISSDSTFMAIEVLNTKNLPAKSSSFTDIRSVLPKLKKGEKYRVNSINFLGGTDVLLFESYPSVDALYMLMKKNKKMIIRIEGHVHRPGKPVEDSENQNLSEYRAKRVYDYLIKKGIEKERMSTIGFSNKYMIYPNAVSEKEASANRRVEINVLSIN
jgi:outer membrane protein OmpA-like peptidoglycan-associated protein